MKGIYFNMKKTLFMIPNLSVGGAEKVLVNLVNNMDANKFDITILTLFAGGVNEQFLRDNIKLKHCFKKAFKANSQILKLFSPEALYKRFIKEKYDIIISYLEGPTARIVSGCTENSTKLVSWIHIQQENAKTASYSFRGFSEAKKCYEKYDRIICVSEYVKNDFRNIFDYKRNIDVLYNTNETNDIIKKSEENVEMPVTSDDDIKICVVGKVSKRKGCDRICRIQSRLRDESIKTHMYFLGVGPDEEYVKNYIKDNKLDNTITLLGYQTNPYKYVKKSDLFVCASLAEGFSTAATEALILGTPIVTVDVSGMKEMLGENNEYGIVTENDEKALYNGIRKMVTEADMLEDYAKRAKERGKFFSTEKTVRAVEKMLLSI